MSESVSRNPEADQPAADAAPALALPRHRRPVLARNAPLRHAGQLLRDAAGPATAEEAAAPAPSTHTPSGAAPDTSEDAVARGVRLGYQVIEEQILQGQKLAQRLSRAARHATGEAADAAGAEPAFTPTGDRLAASLAGDALQGEAAALIERVVGLYRDLGALCLDAVGSVARNPTLRAGLSRVATGATGAPPAAAPGAAATQLAVEVSSSRRTRVALDWRPLRADSRPLVHGLHALQPAAGGPSAVPTVVLVSAGVGQPVVQVQVPESAPAGLYSGLVVDAASNEPCGSLSVTVLA